MTREEFNALPQELRNKAKGLYERMDDTDTGFIRDFLDDLFGEENLKIEPQIRTWNDLVKAGKAKRSYAGIGVQFSQCGMTYATIATLSKVEKKALAMLKIAQLIDVAYGGVVSSQEQERMNVFYYIGFDRGNLIIAEEATYRDYRTFHVFHPLRPTLLAFRIRKQAEDFLKYNENLIKDYYML